MKHSNKYKCPICDDYFLTHVSTTKYQVILECFGCGTIVMAGEEELK